jgi:hypothetical protein
MSYDSDTENLYLVEFKSGRTIYVSFYEVQDVLNYCADEFASESIASIYKEVYFGENDDE